MLNFSVAPMMNCTDRHARYLMRLIAPDVVLYTEMITTQALLHSAPERFLSFDKKEKYLALQLGGNDPQALAKCAKLGQDFGYDEINLNVGCPSPRVKNGAFGACLMLQPKLVAECVKAMQEAISIPVTVKCRIGVDQHDSYENLKQFIHIISENGCQTFIIHARKAWLDGLSPKKNREVPPLCYHVVRQVKKDFSNLNIILNGGIKTMDDIDREYKGIDGIMIGRAAYHQPYFLADIQKKYFQEKVLSRKQVLQAFIPYVEKELQKGIKLASITRHILGLTHGQRNGCHFRRFLSEQSHIKNAGINVLQKAIDFIYEE